MTKKFSKIISIVLILFMCLNVSSLVFAEAGNPYEETPEGTFCWPLDPCPDTNSPMYDRTGVVSGSVGYHTGWDFAVDGGTPIYAIGAGTVTAAGTTSGIGNYCVIKHELTAPFVLDLGNGETINFGTTLYSRYCHMIAPPSVKSGQ
ncbi:MAG: M23 family metallopeptidase [Clostridia bacterium]|nr:M23 family metallopeptidase [Clostridia bacterium]